MTSPALTAHFVPRWPTNPYHDQLARHLGDFQVHVQGESRLKAIARHARRSGQPPAILHLHAVPAFSWRPRELMQLVVFYFRLRWMQRIGTRIVWTVHDISHHETAYPRAERFVARQFHLLADAVIVHSAAAQTTMEEQWGVRRRDRTFIVPHANFIGCYPNRISRHAARSQLDLTRDALTFAFFGNVRPYKGVVQLVRAFRSLACPSARLVIAGEALHASLSREIESAIGGSSQILFHNRFVPDEAVQNYLNAADVVVFPYTKALTSGALILAMSFGKACIAPRLGAIADTLDPRGGFLYDPADPDGLKTALAHAVRAHDQLSQMGEFNRRAAQSWSWHDAARLTNSVYRTALQENVPAHSRSKQLRQLPA